MDKLFTLLTATSGTFTAAFVTMLDTINFEAVLTVRKTPGGAEPCGWLCRSDEAFNEIATSRDDVFGTAVFRLPVCVLLGDLEDSSHTLKVVLLRKLRVICDPDTGFTMNAWLMSSPGKAGSMMETSFDARSSEILIC